jgi:Flp pilus assembly protein TadD
MARGVLAADPESAEALYLLGRMLLAQGAATEAAERLEAAKRLTPDDPNVRSQLGQAYEALGRTERAREELEASRRLEARQ